MGYTRVTPDEIREFIKLYEFYGTYAAVARETGRSPKTVAKYLRQAGSYAALKLLARQEVTKNQE